jgi:hypothetical protein
MSTLGTADVPQRGDCAEHSDSADLWSSLPRGRALGSVPWLPVMWHPTLDQEQAVEAYLSGKSGAEQMALARMMREVETGCVPPARSRTTTDDVPWLKQPGAGRLIALAWNARLESAK